MGIYSYSVDSLHNVQRVSLPFDRFYMPEGEGARTQDLMTPQWTEGQQQQPLEAYALVRVHDGEAVMEDLIIGGRPVQEWMAR